MNTQRWVSLGVLLLVMACAIGCSQRGRSDAQITADVQAKLSADALLANQPIAVQTNNGVVVLSGDVKGDMERMAAENSAAQVNGVKSVVNNLRVATAAAAPKTKPLAQKSKPATPAGAAPRVAQQPAVSKPAPAAQPKPVEQVTVPQGTKVSVRLIDAIDSEKNKVGDVFRATLDSPIVVGDKVVVPKNADIEGQVVEAKSAGHFTGRSNIALVLTKLMVGGKSYELKTQSLSKQGTSRGVRTAETVGGGAAAGALIGGLAGGGKGAAIGGAVGAGAGAGVQAVTKGQQVKFPSEAVLDFELQQPVTVTPAASIPRPEKIG